MLCLISSLSLQSRHSIVLYHFIEKGEISYLMTYWPSFLRPGSTSCRWGWRLWCFTRKEHNNLKRWHSSLDNINRKCFVSRYNRENDLEFDYKCVVTKGFCLSESVSLKVLHHRRYFYLSSIIFENWLCQNL